MTRGTIKIAAAQLNCLLFHLDDADLFKEVCNWVHSIVVSKTLHKDGVVVRVILLLHCKKNVKFTIMFENLVAVVSSSRILTIWPTSSMIPGPFEVKGTVINITHVHKHTIYKHYYSFVILWLFFNGVIYICTINYSLCSRYRKQNLMEIKSVAAYLTKWECQAPTNTIWTLFLINQLDFRIDETGQVHGLN